MKRINIYFRDEKERELVRVCLATYRAARAGLSKGQVELATSAAMRATTSTPEQPKVAEKGFWGETLPSGWRIRDLGPLGKRLEGPDGRWAYRDKSGAFEEYRAACEAEGIKLDA